MASSELSDGRTGIESVMSVKGIRHPMDTPFSRPGNPFRNQMVVMVEMILVKCETIPPTDSDDRRGAGGRSKESNIRRSEIVNDCHPQKTQIFTRTLPPLFLHLPLTPSRRSPPVPEYDLCIQSPASGVTRISIGSDSRSDFQSKQDIHFRNHQSLGQFIPTLHFWLCFGLENSWLAPHSSWLLQLTG